MKRIGTSDLHVFPLNFGGNVFGWTADTDESFRILDAFTATGGNFIDTADAYPQWAAGNIGGESESIMGEWLRRRGNRADVVIATKVGKKTNLTGLRPDTIVEACHDSLQRLGTDYIDLYYCHADDLNTPLAETLEALAQLVKSGKVRYIAASNYSASRLAEALELSRANNWPRFVAVQPHYNLMERDHFEGALQDLCVAEELSCLPYYALASGFLTGKYRHGGHEQGQRAPAAQRYLNPHGDRVLAAMSQIAQVHRVPLATVAIAWLCHQPAVAAPIASASRVDQLPDLMAGAVLSLSDRDLVVLNEASRSGITA